MIQRLKYAFDQELLGNRSTSAVFPDDILDLCHTHACPYCGMKIVLVNSTHGEFIPGVDVYDRGYSCPGCNWWRTHRTPGDSFVGYCSVGLLYKRTETLEQDLHLRRAMERLIVEQNAIYQADARKFEQFVAALFREHLDSEVVHVGRSGDGGVDLIILDSNSGKIPVQVKRRRRPDAVESVSLIREFRGAMVLVNAAEGVIVSTADHFSRPAIEASIRAPSDSTPQLIHLIDCRRLLEVIDAVVRMPHR